MAFDAKVYRILITSPSDVAEESAIARKLIHRWNSDFAHHANIVMLPLSCNADVIPEMGNRAQAIINPQIVDPADVLIGIFGTRLGTPTGVAISGSVEEIERCSKAGKRVALFFSSRRIARENFDAAQFESLREFRHQCEASGYIENFRTRAEFKDKLSRFLIATGQNFAGHKLDGSPTARGQYAGMVYQMVTDGQAGWGYPVATESK